MAASKYMQTIMETRTVVAHHLHYATTSNAPVRSATFLTIVSLHPIKAWELETARQMAVNSVW